MRLVDDHAADGKLETELGRPREFSRVQADRMPGALMPQKLRRPRARRREIGGFVESKDR